MERHKLGLTALTKRPICEILIRAGEPKSSPVAYEIVGADLDGVPIESGFGVTTWEWPEMSQEDYDLLLELQGDVPGKTVYLHTTKRSGASGIDFGDYQAIAGRPTFESRERLICYGVQMPFTQMV